VGLLGGMLKAGIAKKVFDEARKPHNQAKAKDLFRSVTGKARGGGGPGAAGGSTPR
jgi:hypothetical protein